MTEQDAADDGTSETSDDHAPEADAAAESPDAPDDADTDAETTAEGDLDVADDIVEYVEEADTEELAEEVATLRFEVEALEAELDDYEDQVETLQSKLKRKQADFENYKKRMKRRREDEKERATEDLVKRLFDVRDNLKRAVEQDEDADIRDGVESTLRQFDRVFEEENVTTIEPEPGEDVDPERHEVLIRMDSDQPEGTIAEVHRPGYEMAGKVLRAAQVAVSE